MDLTDTLNILRITSIIGIAFGLFWFIVMRPYLLDQLTLRQRHHIKGKEIEHIKRFFEKLAFWK